MIIQKPEVIINTLCRKAYLRPMKDKTDALELEPMNSGGMSPHYQPGVGSISSAYWR